MPPSLNKGDYYASINVKPEGGGGSRANVGHLTSIAFPTNGNLTKNLCPRVGTFAFSARRNGTKSHRTMCSSMRRSSWKLSTAVSIRGKSTCLYKNTSSHYSFSIQIDGAPYFVRNVWIATVKSSENRALEFYFKYFLSIDKENASLEDHERL